MRVAVADEQGRLDPNKFQAWFGTPPTFDTGPPGVDRSFIVYNSRREIKPTPLRLFFPRLDTIPTDTLSLLREFVPAPPEFSVATRGGALPKTLTLHEYSWQSKGNGAEIEKVAVRARETALPAAANLAAALRLVEAGKVRVTDKKRVPTEAARKAIGAVLAGGDFYEPADAGEKYDAAADLAIGAFAWPLLLQAGGLAEKGGDTLKLSAAGRVALTAPPHETLRRLWSAWQKGHDFDEFARIDIIKGQSRADLSAPAGRRKPIVAALGDCPAGKWVAVDDFFRLLRAKGRDFTIARDPFDLYIAEANYGGLNYYGDETWALLQGRFTLAFLFEYAATLGVIDVAYVPPQLVRHDFRSRWGTDDLTCLSRYDGLLWLRVNALGAWVLGQVRDYDPPPPPKSEALRLLSNLDVVATGTIPAADRLVLERFAEPQSQGVWKLTPAKARDVVEAGGSLDELEQFLAHRIAGKLPATATAFLADLRAKVGRLTDAGPARLFECADGLVALELSSDRQIAGKCLPAGERHVVVRDADLPAVRKAARRMGYVWPMTGG